MEQYGLYIHLVIAIDHKWTFEDHLLNIIQKINQKIHTLARISKVYASKEAEKYHENISHNLHIAH